MVDYLEVPQHEVADQVLDFSKEYLVLCRKAIAGDRTLDHHLAPQGALHPGN